MLVSTYRPGTLTMLECRFNKTTHHVIIIEKLREAKADARKRGLVARSCARSTGKRTSDHDDDDVYYPRGRKMMMTFITEGGEGLGKTNKKRKAAKDH